MAATFYLAAAIAVAASVMVITRLNAVHALLYLVVSLLAVAVAFYLLGAPFAAALEVIIYAGAIMVLFVFVVMMLNIGPEQTAVERGWLRPRTWAGPTLLCAALLGNLLFMMAGGGPPARAVGPVEVGTVLYGPYLLAVELASMLLLGALVAAYHIGRWRGAGDT